MIRYPGTILPIVPGPGERVLPGWWDGVGGGIRESCGDI